MYFQYTPKNVKFYDYNYVAWIVKKFRSEVHRKQSVNKLPK